MHCCVVQGCGQTLTVDSASLPKCAVFLDRVNLICTQKVNKITHINMTHCPKSSYKYLNRDYFPDLYTVCVIRAEVGKEIIDNASISKCGAH
jgi:hypothetical protein